MAEIFLLRIVAVEKFFVRYELHQFKRVLLMFSQIIEPNKFLECGPEQSNPERAMPCIDERQDSNRGLILANDYCTSDELESLKLARSYPFIFSKRRYLRRD